MKRLLTALAFSAVFVPAVCVLPASAASTNAKLDVYPIDCVFEQVDNGTSQITFLTPAECGQAVTITNPEPETQELVPVLVVNPEEETLEAVPEETVLVGDSVAVFMSEVALVFKAALSAVIPWAAVSSFGTGLTLLISIDPKSLAPMSVFRFVLGLIFRR